MFNSFLDKIKSQLGSDVNKDSDKFEYKKFDYKPWNADGKYSAFTPSDATNAANQLKANAEKAYTDHVGAGYNWANQEMLNTAISNWQNRDPFSYDFNKDALYQQYKDKYIKQGKMAMADTMGQASAMTGGYGNSYAATAGNQAYQASLENLNDIIPELQQMAYDMYNQKGQDMLNNISLMQSERGFDYGVWGDKANMLAGDRSYYGTEADNAWNRDYGMWNDNRTFDRATYDSDRTLAHGEHTNSENTRYNEYRAAIEDAYKKATLAEQKRQFNESMAFSKKQYNESRQAAQNNSGGIDTSVIGDRLEGMENDGQKRDYLESLGFDDTTVDSYMNLYGTPSQKALNQRQWEVTYDGGRNWFGGNNNNARVKDEYNNEYSISELYKELKKTMDDDEAKKYLIDVQRKLGIWEFKW